MAVSSCPKCEGRTFEMVEVKPINSKVKLNFIQCFKCGTVVGTQDYFALGGILDDLEKIKERLQIPE